MFWMPSYQVTYGHASCTVNSMTGPINFRRWSFRWTGDQMERSTFRNSRHVSNLRIAAVDPGQHNVRGNDNSTRTLTFSRRISKHFPSSNSTRSFPERSRTLACFSASLVFFPRREYRIRNGILKRARELNSFRERERERERIL